MEYMAIGMGEPKERVRAMMIEVSVEKVEEGIVYAKAEADWIYRK